MKNTLKKFREDYAISIERFLQLNTCIEKDNLINRKIKHSEIAFLPLVVPVSMRFAKRYEEEFVVNGKILIVKDDYGKYQSYMNPNTLKSLHDKNMLEQKLKSLKKPFHDLKSLKNNFNQINIVNDNIESVLEDERVIKYFAGEEAIEYSEGISDRLDEIRESR